MIKRLFRKKSSEKEFWMWFEKHSEEYFQLDERKYELLFNNLELQLSKINHDLTFEFSADINKGKREFIISANGIVSAFPDVINLVKSAPKLDKFEIIAFRQRQSGEHEIRYNETVLKTENVFFTYIRDKKENYLDIILYIKDYTDENEDLVGAAFIMLDSLIGEFDVGTKLGEIDFRPYQGERNVRPIMELPNIVDSL
ncbi:hypothetical protein C0966_09330 [Bacillus methanolicus]|uniref:hypothetical protein n=1 Tax=Bacillus methanolicus TaxID=1471 RepID=UPI0023806552|nr:hypothetical protein [Bacillus methanolicus]MDE3839557.1 hypothetical protein [Bacillus methanolicus]